MDGVKKTKKMLTNLRVLEQEVRAGADKLGEETTAKQPEDLQLMFAGKMAVNLTKAKVAHENMMHGYVRAYGEVFPDVSEKLQELVDIFEKDFSKTKRHLEKTISTHPLVERLCQIKGFTPYRLSIIMSMVKDVAKFDTPSKLCVYAGVAPKSNLKVCKRNLNVIRQNTDNPDFGYNTRLQGQLYITSESLLKARGYFKDFYDKVRSRLIQRAINNGECFLATKEDQKASNGVMKAGEYYMLGRKNQSLKMWSHSNTMTRIGRTLLHLIYTEWRTHLELPVRNPYPIEYLGHQQIITLDDVLAFEATVKE